jgi:hypothetical protein
MILKEEDFCPLEESPSQYHCDHHKYYLDPHGIVKGPRGRRPATNRLSQGRAPKPKFVYTVYKNQFPTSQ